MKRLFSLILFIVTLHGLSSLAGAQTVDNQKDKAIKTVRTPLILTPKGTNEDFLHKYVINPEFQYTGSQNKSSTGTKSAKLSNDASKKEGSMANDVLCWLQDKYSLMMDVMPNQITNVMLYRFIDEWYGVRYRMGGTTKKGIDCSAFVQQLYKYAFGTNLLRTAGLQYESAVYIKNKMDLKEGDLVFFSIGSSRISHVGVYLNNNYFVHSASSKGVSIAKLSSDYWAKYFVGGGRILNRD